MAVTTKPLIQPNARHPLTGAPVINLDLPPDAPLPPPSTGEQYPPANARDPTTGAPHTSHTTNPVPIILQANLPGAQLRDGRLADVAPTLLHLMGLAQPPEMTGTSLVVTAEIGISEGPYELGWHQSVV